MPQDCGSVLVLSVEDLLKIHEALIHHFDEAGDPISPAGVRNSDLLASAVLRQTIGTNSQLKYADPRENAATLMYGVCMNHPFHNGNKRTALVAFLAHLNTNGYIIKNEIRHKEIYNKVLRLASHDLPEASNHSEEVSHLVEWTRKIVRKTQTENHPLTFRKLRQILQKYGLYFDNYDKGFVSIYKDEISQKVGFLGLGRKQVTKKTRIMQICFRGEGMTLEPSTIRLIRQKCNLTEEDGVDSLAFYNLETAADSLIAGYSNILRKLSHR